MAIFPLLADPVQYDAHTFPLIDPFAYEWWVKIFENHLPSMIRRCHDSEVGKDQIEARIEAFHLEFTAYLNDMRDNAPTGPIPREGAMTAFQICIDREALLRKHDIDDPYRVVKYEENQQALKLLPEHLTWLSQFEDRPDQQAREVIAGVFAGNLFDLGASNTTAMYEAGEFDFHRLQEELAEGEWLVDHSEVFVRRLMNRPWKKAMVFIDNAGADLVLGMLPFVRLLLSAGTQVVMAANSEPSLNDVTSGELEPVLDQVAGFDELYGKALSDGQLSVLASGCITPEIDLTLVSQACVEACEDVELVVLEGMGRSVETNWDAAFTCDALKIATIKEGWLAEHFGGKQYDPVCRFDVASA